MPRSSNAVSENSIVFFEGGHDHDGISSSLIDTEQYSIYDFIVGKTGSNSRQIRQQRNFDNLKNVISNIVINDVLGPSGVRLLPNSIQSVHIAAGAVTASELAANIVLINNVIRSNNFDGTIASNGNITSDGTSGWAITYSGDAVFDAASIRGTLTAGAVEINSINYWYSNGRFRVGTNALQYMEFYNNNLTVSGNIIGLSGKIGDLEINESYLYQGGTFAGDMSIGNLYDASGGSSFFTDYYDNGLGGVWIVGPGAVEAGNNLLISSERMHLWDNGANATGHQLAVWKNGIQYDAANYSDRIEFSYDPTPGLYGELSAIIHHPNGNTTVYCISSCGAVVNSGSPEAAADPEEQPPPPAPECLPCPVDLCCTPSYCVTIKGESACYEPV